MKAKVVKLGKEKAVKLGSRACITNPYNNQDLIGSLQLGSFSEVDIDEAFNRIDVNHDGYISRQEMVVILEAWATKNGIGPQQLEKMADALMAKWSEDGEGGNQDRISKEQFRRNAVALGEQVHPVIYQLSGCLFMMCLPFGIIVPYEPLLVQSLNITAAQFGIAQGAMFVAKFLVNIPITDVVDRFGSKPILIGNTLLLGVSLGGLSFVSSLEHLILCRAIGGVAIAGLAASLTAPAIKVQTPLNRARSNAPFTQAMNAGTALGPAIGGLLSGFMPMETAFATVGGLFILSAVANHYIYTEIAPGRDSQFNNPVQLFTYAFKSWKDVFDSSPQVRWLCATHLALWSAMAGTNMTLLPLLLWVEPYSFTTTSIGALTAGIGVLGVVATQPLAVFADKYGRRNALGLGTTLMATSMAAVPLTGSAAAITGALAATALGQNLLAPAIQALMIDTVSKNDPSKLTQAMSLLRSIGDVGMVSGAATIGFIGTEFGFVAGYEASSSVLLLMGLCAFLRLPKPPPVAKL